MLLKFYISLLLPPSIKFRFDTVCKENAQYLGNVCNIVQLLLRPSNDVQENPGPTTNDISDCGLLVHNSCQLCDIFG